jgi:hypothetical protein
MNTDNYRLIEYTGELFRADTTNPSAINGAAHYGSDALHFFTTKKEEVAPYTRIGKTYTKTWATKPGTPLALLDIMDLKTRLFLENYISKANLDKAFPIRNGKVYRKSEKHTAKIDGQIVFDICNLKDELGADGYYMVRQEEGNGFLAFHSEIGLCNHAFGKLILKGEAEDKHEAPRARANNHSRSRSIFGHMNGTRRGPRNGNNGTRRGPRNGNRNNGTRKGPRNGNGNRKGNGNSVMRSLFGSPSPNKNRGEPLTMENLNTTNIVPQKLTF